MGTIVRNVWRTEGLLGFWRGNVANCVRIVPNKGILFMFNDLLVSVFTVPGQPLSDLHRLAAGSLSGFVLLMTTYPLDITQTRLASGGAYRGITDCLAQTYRAGGWRGLYAGGLPSVLGIVPYTGMQFLVYDKCVLFLFFVCGASEKKCLFALFILTLLRRVGRPAARLKKVLRRHDAAGQTRGWHQLVCGAVAGAVAQSVSYPFDTVRRQMQVHSVVGRLPAPGAPRMRDYFVAVWQTHGLKGFYRGALLNIARAGPSQAIQFFAFEQLMALFPVAAV
jgi:hypothetical protein